MATKRHPAVREFAGSLDTLVRARYPFVYLVTWEEPRVDGILNELAARHGKHLVTWSATRGLRRVAGPRPGAPLEPAKTVTDALAAIARLAEPSLVVLHDFHPHLDDPAVIRALRELAWELKNTFTTVFFVSPVLVMPPELEKEVTVLDVPLPDFADLADLLRGIATITRAQGRVVDLPPADADRLVRAAQGLTLAEAENAFARAIAIDDRLDASDLGLILEEKRQVIRKSGILEYIPAAEEMTSVGGLASLKQWLHHRTRAFGEDARRFGLPEPKGLLLLGVQGCGKSLVAKAIAQQWGLPMLRLDMGRIFGSLVGSSEENMRKAIRMAEGISPVVLWVDEIEKSLAGSRSSADTDGGTGARVFASLLTWMQEKTAPVFVVATANSVDALPPELLRKGRFDEIFFVDLPSPVERAEIFGIHLKRRYRDPAHFDLARLAALADGYSGAEIEQALVAALYRAFDDTRELAQADLERALTETRPLSVTMAEDIARLREWAATRTRPASEPT